MAQSKSFFGLRRGSTKSHTYQVLRGQQITKDRVYDVANPRTNAQTLQRVIFSSAVKFYKRSVSQFFRFAYESKRPNESDYNAFMRLNSRLAPLVSRDDYTNPIYPVIAPFVLSEGTLPELEVLTAGESQYRVRIAALPDVEAITTVGQLSQSLISQYGYLPGDIVTKVLIRTDMRYGETITSPSVAPRWEISQFLLDPSSNVALSTYGMTAALVTDAWELDFDIDGLAEDGLSGCAGAALIVSRKLTGGLMVTTTPVALNQEAAAYYAVYSDKDSATAEAVLQSWGATGDAILQGSLVQA